MHAIQYLAVHWFLRSFYFPYNLFSNNFTPTPHKYKMNSYLFQINRIWEFHQPSTVIDIN